MTPEMLDLARRSVACNGWRWMPGMRVLLSPDIVGRILDDGSIIYDGSPGYRIAVDELPDLSDHATLGCLLALVREKHNDPSAHVYWSALFRAWAVSFSCRGMGNYATEADALVAALEAAP